ncbi:MAG: hydroxymethylglutaryl-CoA synthase [Rhodoferax sp.]|nr:hydroxymethylglutaryl-CoA synthase [Rhodoferax sp.]
MNKVNIGIESLGFYSPRYYFPLSSLAQARGLDDDEKYGKGLWQEKMSVAPPNEDIVTMGASAAAYALEGVDKTTICAILFATESSFDYSKSAGIFIHDLLGLPQACMVLECKQACSSGAAALKISLGLLALQDSHKKILVITSDISLYELGSAAEPTQGAGACAFVVSTDPKILTIENYWGHHAKNVPDFWRPNYMLHPIASGKQSIENYLQSLQGAWQQYHQESNFQLQNIDGYCFHLPYSRMAEKAIIHLYKKLNKQTLPDEMFERCMLSTSYSKEIGNCYTASLFIGLLSLLENNASSLEGARIGMFSYGSGCSAIFFSGIISEGYAKHISQQHTRVALDERSPLSYDEYEKFHTFAVADASGNMAIPQYQTGRFRLDSVVGHHRNYATASS